MDGPTTMRVIAEARSWIGTPYHHRAKVKEAGVDCAQLLIGVYAAVGLVDDFDTGDYPPDWMLHRDEERYLKIVMQYMEPAIVPMRGGIAVFKWGRTYSHAGIITRWPNIVHAYAKERMVVESDIHQLPLKLDPMLFYHFR